ncbi:GreA/GreB family elongation factor [Fulvivirga sediminis]|nr:GreA/GreB family elongation factor [Fulvivirga sediminis]
MNDYLIDKKEVCLASLFFDFYSEKSAFAIKNIKPYNLFIKQKRKNMSRGFVKEEDQEEIPMVPPRADLPAGATNYVTRNGMDLLLEEREELIKERDNIDSVNENEKRIATNFINAKLNLLNERINSAKIVPIEDQYADEVRFGATVTLKIKGVSKLQKYQIVGVDEADINKGKIAFISPIARLLIEKKVGEEAVLKLAKGERVFEVKAISYDA